MSSMITNRSLILLSSSEHEGVKNAFQEWINYFDSEHYSLMKDVIAQWPNHPKSAALLDTFKRLLGRNLDSTYTDECEDAYLKNGKMNPCESRFLYQTFSNIFDYLQTIIQKLERLELKHGAIAELCEELEVYSKLQTTQLSAADSQISQAAFMDTIGRFFLYYFYEDSQVELPRKSCFTREFGSKEKKIISALLPDIKKSYLRKLEQLVEGAIDYDTWVEICRMCTNIQAFKTLFSNCSDIDDLDTRGLQKLMLQKYKDVAIINIPENVPIDHWWWYTKWFLPQEYCFDKLSMCHFPNIQDIYIRELTNTRNSLEERFVALQHLDVHRQNKQIKRTCIRLVHKMDEDEHIRYLAAHILNRVHEKSFIDERRTLIKQLKNLDPKIQSVVFDDYSIVFQDLLPF